MINKETQNSDEILPQLVLTSKAVEWVTTYIKPVCGTDFIGYIFNVNDILFPKRCKNPPGIAVDWNGNIKMFSLNPKVPTLPNKDVCKWIKKLDKLKFFEQAVIPFPEFDYRLNIKVNPDEATIIEEPLFSNR